MARPAKSINTSSKHNTAEDIAVRKESEEKLRGKSDKLKPPTYLTAAQKKIFRYIVNNLEEAGILGNLDLYVLSVAAVTISNLIELDKAINTVENMELKLKMMGTRDKYTKDFFKCCNELSLSPQARAKISISATKNGKENRNPLLDALDL